MSVHYKKASLRPPSGMFGGPQPRTKVPRGSTSPATTSLKASSSYTKAALGQQPNAFSGNSFGDTALQQTPSIVGMGKPSP